jgi:hypothetical protein
MISSFCGKYDKTSEMQKAVQGSLDMFWICTALYFSLNVGYLSKIASKREIRGESVTKMK